MYVSHYFFSLLFRWVAIPWLQVEIDKWVNFKNKTAPRAFRHKILPHSVPTLIRTSLSLFNALDFKVSYVTSILITNSHAYQIPVNSKLLDEMEALYTPPDHAVFDLVPPAFHKHMSQLYITMGQPEVNVDTFWNVYLSLLRRIHEGRDEQLTGILTSHQGTLNQDPDEMPLLPGMDAFRLGQPLRPVLYGSYMGGLDESSLASAVQQLGIEYAEFTTDEEDEDGDGEDDDRNEGEGEDND